MPEFSGIPRGEGRRFAVVGSRFNERITTRLAEGAVNCLVKHGAAFDDIDMIWVPGAWELPAAVGHLLTSDRYAAVIAVGAVIRGETPHFDYVAGEASRGLADLQRDYGTPIGFGLLTVDTLAQAEARAEDTNASDAARAPAHDNPEGAADAHGNKGWDAALAALEMADLFARLDAAQGFAEDHGAL